MSESDPTKPDTKSLFDSTSSPIFAPPAVAPPAVAPPAVTPAVQASAAPPDPKPRTSDAQSSVSGEFDAPASRPEPATPPRFEAPEGVTPNYDRNEDEWDDGLEGLRELASRVESDERETPDADDPRGAADWPSYAGVPQPQLDRDDRDDRDDADNQDDQDDQDEDDQDDRLQASASNARVEVADGGGSRNLLITLAVLAVLVLVGILVNNSRTPTESKVAAREAKQDPLEPLSKRGAKTDHNPARAGNRPLSNPRVEAAGGTETGDGETGEPSRPEPRDPANGDPDSPRDPSVIPPNTPEDNAKAFFKLPVSIHDGPPVGGIGRSGVHIDAISMARGRENSDCEDPTRSFSASEADYVNVCIRVVHPRELEWLRVIWEKDGRVTRRGRVRIPDLHAYTTRAYLLIRPEYLGSWRVRIAPEGEEDTDLAVAEFEITE